MSKEKTPEQEKLEEFYLPEDSYSDEESFEEEIACPDGFTEEEDCGAPWRLGIESCEFLCPFRRLDGLLDLEKCYYCGKDIKKGEIVCSDCDREAEK